MWDALSYASGASTLSALGGLAHVYKRRHLGWAQATLHMAEGEDQALEERLKSALWFSVGKIVDEETLRLGVNATPQFIGALTELVWAQIENVSTDLKSFANHAGRSTISTDDVMLLSRRNEGLEAVLRNYMDKQNAGEPNRKKR